MTETAHLSARIEALEVAIIELMTAIAAESPSIRTAISERLEDAADDAAGRGDPLVAEAISIIAVSFQNHM